MASLLSKARLLGLCFPLMWVACGAESLSPLPPGPSVDSPEDLPLPTGPSVSTFSLERENQGPYLERTMERFHAISSRSDLKSVLWSASGGKLETQGMQATWTLPRAGTASLTLTAETQTAQQITETYQFRVSAEASAQAEGPLANVPLAPVPVDTSNDVTGSTCDLAFDSSGNGNLIYLNDSHPSLWYGSWNGSTWTTQEVDGMGFNTGGIVSSNMALVVDNAGKPHIVYTLAGKGVWYATLSGSSWIRERVDSSSYPPEDGRVSIALDPSNGNRPTIVYPWRTVDSTWGTVYRSAVVYRTGTNAWTATTVTFPAASPNNQDQLLKGEILFDPSGTLYVPFGKTGLGSWKTSAGPAAFEFPFNPYSDSQASLARTTAGHLLLRSAGILLDITPGSSLASSTASLSYLEAFSPPVGDLIFASGKPQEIHLHGNSLELVTPNATNLWTYTSVGSADINSHIALAQRPTTGTIHYCFQSGSKVMFQ